ncbi:sulfatase-like hydrolase/transferase [Flavobacteriaceae bacterium]|nr:sulfatase-like hydrolase/transferase [Flavobacteriaceae bacterium]MDA8900367.1 sulfatase-like hydrolase/transferase [Flavobacteriaceae bacterium]MDA8993053.1 sulfatase-like hydrolase/transferase [Flavobacteriaceae bacterium]
MWKFGSLLVILLLAACQTPKKAAAQKPNILFLFADDQRADALGLGKNPYLQTPHIDALAAEGVHFENCYVMGGHHGAICAPSRAMLMSGKSLFQVYDRLDGVLTLPQYLSQFGYRTFGTGKWHNGAASFEATFQEGENVFLGGMSNHFKVPCQSLGSDGKLGAITYKSFSTDLFADAAERFLEAQAAQSDAPPFFCYVAFTAPHDPRSPAPPYQIQLDTQNVPLPGNFLPLHPFRFDDFNVRDETLAPWPRTPEIIQSSLSEYYALIRHIDDRVGQLIATLKKTGAYDNTIIIYAADNGLALGSHGLLGKQNLYEHSTNVPLLISGPGIPKNQVKDALVYLYDLFPTLTDLLVLPRPEGLNGMSLAGILEGSSTDVRENLYTAYRNTVRALRDKDWKLIRYPQIDHTQLFNLKEDPEEINNLADVPEQQTRLQIMLDLMQQAHDQAQDTMNLWPKKISDKNYDYRTLKQTPDPWQPDYILEKYFYPYTGK